MDPATSELGRAQWDKFVKHFAAQEAARLGMHLREEDWRRVDRIVSDRWRERNDACWRDPAARKAICASIAEAARTAFRDAAPARAFIDDAAGAFVDLEPELPTNARAPFRYDAEAIEFNRMRMPRGAGTGGSAAWQYQAKL